MAHSRELTPIECEDLLRLGSVGRIAVCSPDGPHVIPVNYQVYGGSVVFRTSPYSAVGTYARDSKVSFEVDYFDLAHETGWSVLARGAAAVVHDPDEVAEIRALWHTQPWADGLRNTYFRVTWTEITGRMLGQVAVEAAPGT